MDQLSRVLTRAEAWLDPDGVAAARRRPPRRPDLDHPRRNETGRWCSPGDSIPSTGRPGQDRNRRDGHRRVAGRARLRGLRARCRAPLGRAAASRRTRPDLRTRPRLPAQEPAPGGGNGDRADRPRRPRRPAPAPRRSTGSPHRSRSQPHGGWPPAAQVISCVLGGDSQILDWGRTKRLYTPTQRLALVERDGGCAMCGAPPGSYEGPPHPMVGTGCRTHRPGERRASSASPVTTASTTTAGTSASKESEFGHGFGSSHHPMWTPAARPDWAAAPATTSPPEPRRGGPGRRPDDTTCPGSGTARTWARPRPGAVLGAARVWRPRCSRATCPRSSYARSRARTSPGHDTALARHDLLREPVRSSISEPLVSGIRHTQALGYGPDCRQGGRGVLARHTVERTLDPSRNRLDDTRAKFARHVRKCPLPTLPLRGSTPTTTGDPMSMRLTHPQRTRTERDSRTAYRAETTATPVRASDVSSTATMTGARSPTPSVRHMTHGSRRAAAAPQRTRTGPERPSARAERASRDRRGGRESLRSRVRRGRRPRRRRPPLLRPRTCRRGRGRRTSPTPPKTEAAPAANSHRVWLSCLGSRSALRGSVQPRHHR